MIRSSNNTKYRFCQTGNPSPRKVLGERFLRKPSQITPLDITETDRKDRKERKEETKRQKRYKKDTKKDRKKNTKKYSETTSFIYQ